MGMAETKINYLAILMLLLILSDYSMAQVFINQVGYLNTSPKYVYCSSNADSFHIIEVSTDQIKFSGLLSLSIVNDVATGFSLSIGDFSSFQREGNYYIRTNLNEISYPFDISNNVFENLYRKSLKGFYFQRCGMILSSNYADGYSHPSCHNADAVFHSSTNQTGTILTTGGWHDAGDYGKYIVNAGITVGTLLMAYESFPQLFAYDDLNIPESGNGIPDLLDEVKYELLWFLKMQNPNGGVYFKVTREQFEPFVMPQNDPGTRYVYSISSTATADFAAVMARAYRLFASFDSNFANQCLNASKLAWSFLVANPAIVPSGGFKNPSGTATGEYGDSNDSDERLWAASELFQTTGEITYKSYFESHYSSGGIINSTMGWQNVKDLAQLTYLNSTQTNASSTVKTQIKNSLISYCNNLVNRSAINGFGVAINPGEYYWGSNSDILNKAILLIYAYDQTKNYNYYEVALNQLNYILGTNAHNLSFVTGVGSKSVMHPHHRPSASDGILNPVPGLLAGGPNQYLNDPLLQSLFNSSTPPALCYVDTVDSYASNEIAINWNAPLVFVSGYFSKSNLSSTEEQGMILPEKFNLEQNYPNPFNPSTKISWLSPVSSWQTLKVYDVLGNEVATLVDEYKPAGNYETEFNTTSIKRQISSGVYFYQLKTENFIQTKKMILEK